MRNLIRTALATGAAGLLVLGGAARAQQQQMGQGTGGSGSSSDTASGGGGASAGTGNTMSGAPSAGAKIDPKLQGQLEKIHADNQAEVQLGKLAEQNAQSPEVKKFGEKMQTDHQKGDAKLTAHAETLGISLEGKDFQKAQEEAAETTKKLESKTGAEFDKAYMARMVKDHEGDIKTVKDAQKRAEKAKQPELAATLGQLATGMQTHLALAKQTEKSLGKGGAAASSGASTSGTGSSGTGSSGTESSKKTKPSQPGQSQ
jgi:putative membrane protein